jgi:hypothetical protein
MNPAVPHPAERFTVEPKPLLDRSSIAFRITTHRKGERKPAKLFPAGKGFVQVFGRKPGPFTVAWRELDGTRRRSMRSTWPKAKAFAETKASNLANLQTGVDQLSPVDAASHLRALENLRPTGQAIEQATAEHAQRQQRLAALAVSFDTMADWFEQNRPRDFKPMPLPDLVAAFLAQKDGTISEDYQSHLEVQLEKFADAFTAPLHTLAAADIRAWLSGLKMGLRSRHNYRAALDQLATWAKAVGYLPRAWSEMDHVPDPGQKSGEIKILTPEQMTRLITARQHAEECGRARKTLVPFLALQAFAGLRHEEAVKLDWRDVHFDDRYLYVSKGIAKTGRDRIIPICDSLAA